MVDNQSELASIRSSRLSNFCGRQLRGVNGRDTLRRSLQALASELVCLIRMSSDTAILAS